MSQTLRTFDSSSTCNNTKMSQTSVRFDSFPIPENSLQKAPSAELADGQTDQDSLGLDYDTLDKMLLVYERAEQAGKNLAEIKSEIKDAGFSEEKIDRVLGLIEANKFKQPLTPPHP